MRSFCDGVLIAATVERDRFDNQIFKGGKVIRCRGKGQLRPIGDCAVTDGVEAAFEQQLPCGGDQSRAPTRALGGCCCSHPAMVPKPRSGGSISAKI
jgi:hypothetical protein